MSESEFPENGSDAMDPEFFLNEPRDLISILSDDRARQDLREQSDTFCALYGRILRDARLIKNLEPIIQLQPVKKVETVIYLIDADVVRNLIDPKHGTSWERRLASQSFEDPQFRYGIPVGAFSELVNWFYSLSSGYGVKWERWVPVGGSSNDDLIKGLAGALGLRLANPSHHPLDTEERHILIKEISSAAARFELSASELLQFLSRPNFKDVYFDTDELDRTLLQGLLGSVERRDDLARDARDENDALNLAVVCKASREQRVSGRFVLLTQTGILLNLVRRLDRTQYAKLAQLFGKPVHPAGYPVMRPEQAFCVEELREDGRITSESLHWVETIEATFRALAGEFFEPEGAFSELLPEIQIEKATSIYKLLDKVKILKKDSLFRKIVRERLIRRSDPQPVETQLDLFYGTATSLSKREIAAAGEEMEWRLHSLFGLLTEVDRRLSEISPTTYSVSSDLHPSGRLRRIKVLSKRPDESIIDGELYFASESRSYRPLAYSLQWKTVCQPRLFLQHLQRIFAIAEDPWKRATPQSLHVTRAHDDESEPQEGFLVFTNRGAYRARLQEVLRLSLHGGNIKQKLVSAIAKALSAQTAGAREESETRDVLEKAQDSGTSEKEVEIEAIRVQTWFGEFQLGLTADHLGNREVAVISRYNIAEQIASLCQVTSLLGVFPGRLNEALQEFTAQFSVYTNATTSTVVTHDQPSEALRLQ